MTILRPSRNDLTVIDTFLAAFLSNLRLSVYMCVVSVAISLSFHLRTPATALERRLAMPLGLIFWLLSVACLTAGLGNYIKTVNKYSRKVAIVQSGWRTQVCLSIVLTLRSFPPFFSLFYFFSR
jgi:hypothetical protein